MRANKFIWHINVYRTQYEQYDGAASQWRAATLLDMSAISTEEWKAIYRQEEKSMKQLHSMQCHQHAHSLAHLTG